LAVVVEEVVDLAEAAALAVAVVVLEASAAEAAVAAEPVADGKFWCLCNQAQIHTKKHDTYSSFF
jgi:hypothetical protein